MRDKLLFTQGFVVWSEVDLPQGCKSIGTRWALKRKTEQDGSTRYHVWLVAQGFSQRPGVDVFDALAPTATATTVCFIISVVAAHDCHSHVIDIRNVFLNALVSEDIYLKVPFGCEQQQ